jgi:hypothetical protein
MDAVERRLSTAEARPAVCWTSPMVDLWVDLSGRSVATEGGYAAGELGAAYLRWTLAGVQKA